MQVTPPARVAVASAALLVLAGLPGPAVAAPLEGDAPCLAPAEPGGPSPARTRGGDGDDHRTVTAADQAAIERQTEQLLAGERLAAEPTTTRVPVRVHVMAAKDRTGNVRRGQIVRQVEAMNEHFGGAESELAAPTGFRFVLKGVDRHFRTRWHRDLSSRKYRKRTRIGGARTLNIWIVGFDYLGVATFPWDYARRGRVDGVRIDHRTLPGGPLAHYDEGKTVTHETGHWLGLFHTFQGGCSVENDSVDDTPAQQTATAGCPADVKDTCPAAPGTDPIHNYMDYSYDSCMNQFTPGQEQRMREMWTAYRA